MLSAGPIICFFLPDASPFINPETPRWVTKEKLRAPVEGARIVRKELSRRDS
jgi:hypothetical protein